MCVLLTSPRHGVSTPADDQNDVAGISSGGPACRGGTDDTGFNGYPPNRIPGLNLQVLLGS